MSFYCSIVQYKHPRPVVAIIDDWNISRFAVRSMFKRIPLSFLRQDATDLVKTKLTCKDNVVIRSSEARSRTTEVHSLQTVLGWT